MNPHTSNPDDHPDSSGFPLPSDASLQRPHPSAFRTELFDEFSLLGGEQVLEALPAIETFAIDHPVELDALDDTVRLLLSSSQRRGRMPTASLTSSASVRGLRLASEYARDGLIMSMFAFDELPELCELTLLRLAHMQGVRDTPLSLDHPRFDVEELGKIPHEIRDPQSSAARGLTAAFGWEWPYFGSIDATPLFITLLCRHARRDLSFLDRRVLQRDGEERSMGQAFLRAMDWLIASIDRHPLGLLGTYAASNSSWQTWRDSVDAYHQSDGTLARGLVAPFAAQVFAYNALVEAARLIDALRFYQLAGFLRSEVEQHETTIAAMGRPISTAKLGTLRLVAEELRSATLQTMWIDRDGGYFAAAHQLDASFTGALDIKTCDMGLALNGSFLKEACYQSMRDALVNQLTDAHSPLVCPSGIRTLAQGEVRFRSGAVHNGAVWPWINAWIASGLRQHGYDAEAERLENAILDIIRQLGCYPQFVRGSSSAQVSLNHVEIQTRAPDGNGAFFEHFAIEPSMPVHGWSVFAAWSIYHRRRLD